MDKNGQETPFQRLPKQKREAPVSASLSINNYYLLSLAIGRSFADAECLFAHAKMRKYGTQNFVGADFAYDFAKVVEGFAQVLGDQIGRKWL